MSPGLSFLEVVGGQVEAIQRLAFLVALLLERP